MGYGLSSSSSGKDQVRRNREMVKQQVCTMATVEKIASGGDWYTSVWTTDAKVWVQKNCRKGMRSVETIGTENCQRRQSATFRTLGVLDKRRWSLPCTMRTSGSFYKKSMCMGSQIDT